MKLYLHGSHHNPDGTVDTMWTSEVEWEDAPLPWQLAGRQYTASGYGRRIPTTKMVRFNGKWRRVYCAIWSNSGTCYIGKLGEFGERILVREY